MLIILKKIKKEFIKNRPISKTQLRFKSERHNVFTEKSERLY